MNQPYLLDTTTITTTTTTTRINSHANNREGKPMLSPSKPTMRKQKMVPTGTADESVQIYWQRKNTVDNSNRSTSSSSSRAVTRIRDSKQLSDGLPPPAPIMQSHTRTPVVSNSKRSGSRSPGAVRMRKRSTSKSRPRLNNRSRSLSRSKLLSATTAVSTDTPSRTNNDYSGFHDSDKSLGDFVNQEEVRNLKRGKRPSSTRQILVHQHVDQQLDHSVSSSDFNNNSHSRSHSHSHSMSSKSFNSSAEDSFQSSSSSNMSSGCHQPSTSSSASSAAVVATPTHKRKGHAGRNAKLRQQLREQHKSEKHLLERNNSASRGGGMTATKSPSKQQHHNHYHQLTRSNSHSKIGSRRTSSRRLLMESIEATANQPSATTASTPRRCQKPSSNRPSSMRNLATGNSTKKNQIAISEHDDDHDEIDESGVFHFVRHHNPCSMEEYKKQPSVTSLARHLDNGDVQPHNLEKDNKQKGTSSGDNNKSQILDGTWHEDNLLDDLSTIHSRKGIAVDPENLDVQEIIKVLKATSFVPKEDNHPNAHHSHETEEEENDSELLTINSTVKERVGDDSFQSLDWKDFPSTWKSNNSPTKMKKGFGGGDVSAATCTTSATSGLTEHFQSQSLTISLGEMPCSSVTYSDAGSTIGHESLQNSAGDFGFVLGQEESIGRKNASPEQEVYKQDILDRDGRRGVYTGTISTYSGKPNGDGKIEYIDDDEEYIGRFVHGRWSGYGTWRCQKTLEEHTGFFENQVRHGPGTTKFCDGRIFEGTYNKGVKVEGKMTYVDHSTYVGTFENGVRSGRGTYTFSNGSFFSGEFSRDKMSSGVLTYPNGRRFRGQWKDGLRHGPGKEFKADGRIAREGTWKDGQFVS